MSKCGFLPTLAPCSGIAAAQADATDGGAGKP
jgi:hypothetical protein